MTEDYTKLTEERAQKMEAAAQSSEKSDAGEPDKDLDPKFIHDCVNKEDVGCGLLLQKVMRDWLIYNLDDGYWYVWMVHYWERDKGQRAEWSVEFVALKLDEEADRLTQEINKLESEGASTDYFKSVRKKCRVTAKYLRTIRGRKNCLEASRTSGGNPLARDGSDFDNQPYRLACLNGVVNLKNGEIEPGNPNHFISKHVPIIFPKDGINAQPSNWTKALWEIFNGDQAKIDFVQRVLGLSLLGVVLEAIIIFWVGRGRNGKSLIMKIIKKILGSLAVTLPSGVLMKKGGMVNPSAPTPEIMMIKGARIVISSETGERQVGDGPTIKVLTGGDSMFARGVHAKNTIEFSPTHTLFCLTNYPPAFSSDDYALWERIVLIEFPVSFVDREPAADYERRADKHLEEKLDAELPEILGWMVKGCLDYQAQGLNPPPSIKNSTREYHRDQDDLADFIDDCCVTGPQYSVGATDLYNAFSQWWEDNISDRVPKQKWFGSKMTKAKSFEKVRSPKITYRGIGLLDDKGFFLGE